MSRNNHGFHQQNGVVPSCNFTLSQLMIGFWTLYIIGPLGVACGLCIFGAHLVD